VTIQNNSVNEKVANRRLI